jgi:hypothetical protein
VEYNGLSAIRNYAFYLWRDLYLWRDRDSLKQFYIQRITKIRQFLPVWLKKLNDRLKASHFRLEIYFKILNQRVQDPRKCFFYSRQSSFTVQPWNIEINGLSPIQMFSYFQLFFRFGGHEVPTFIRSLWFNDKNKTKFGIWLLIFMTFNGRWYIVKKIRPNNRYVWKNTNKTIFFIFF